MRRIASHYIYWGKPYKMHYLELADDGSFAGIYPLSKEIAGTEFYDGILVPVAYDARQVCSDVISISSEKNLNLSRKESIFSLLDALNPSACIKKNTPVRLILLSGNPMTATELSTNYGCGNSNVE